jgi:uncharacterized tellurite resistance protein B-like protein
MDTISFDKLLIKTAFCCMASDGHIDDQEIKIIKTMCRNSILFNDFNFEDEINNLIVKINKDGIHFLSYYLDLISNSTLTEKEEILLIDFAINTIKADDKIEYSEIKFFKNIRHRLSLSNDTILTFFPDFEDFLEDDVVSNTKLENFTSDFINSIILPKFEFIVDTKENNDQ